VTSIAGDGLCRVHFTAQVPCHFSITLDSGPKEDATGVTVGDEGSVESAEEHGIRQRTLQPANRVPSIIVLPPNPSGHLPLTGFRQRSISRRIAWQDLKLGAFATIPS
jgi:hypothetical protein